MDLIGQRFRDIRVLGLIGEGAMGAVYSAHHETLDRKVALKALHFDARLDEEAHQRMLREARALSKLDHPNACRIYDYLREAGQDLLVLEYIDGKTLESVRGNLSYKEKLRVAASIASVLVAAHRAGIVHRDLKPENVMMTSSGDVKVLDFGLARLMHMRSAGGSGPHAVVNDVPDASMKETTPSFGGGRESKRSFLLTAAGITMGTPLYMSPEQARGEALTPASDMYTFGLVLQTLFTGIEPHPELLSAREVILRAARNVTEPVRGTDRAVIALIEHLKQTAPTDRPTAGETLAKLNWIMDRPKRIGRRSAAAALVLILGTGTWRYTVDLAEQRTLAVKARAEAEHRRGQAEDLIDFMVDDLHKQLVPIGKVDILDEAAERAMAYMSSQRPELMAADELAHNATALHNVGKVRGSQGKRAEALKAFQQSLILANAAVKKEPSNLQALFTLGQSQFWVGETHRRMGNKQVALAKMKDYLATSERLARAAPANQEYQVELAYGYSNVGSMLQVDKDYDGALVNYQRCLAIKQGRLRTDPSNREWQADLATTINKLAFANQSKGDLVQARIHFEEENRILKKLVSEKSDHAPWRNRLVTSHWYLAGLLNDLGEVDEAAAKLAAALEDAERLVKLDGANTLWRRNLIVSLANLGNTERMRGNLAEARRLLERVRPLQRELERDAPEMKEWRTDAPMIDLWLAMTLYESNELAAAEQLAVRTVGALREPELTADAHLLLGQIAARQRRPEDARAHWQLAADAVGESKGLRVADRRARALLVSGKTTEAQPILDWLREARYANRDLTTVVASINGSSRKRGMSS